MGELARRIRGFYGGWPWVKKLGVGSRFYAGGQTGIETNIRVKRKRT